MKETDMGTNDEIMEALKKDRSKILDLVQNLIERCLQHYMSQKEVVNTLSVQAKIEPGFIRLVWEKLEEGNREFFNAYWLRLMVKEQIMQFNRLLEKQVEMMHQKCPTNVASLPMSNGSHLRSMHQNSACYPSDHSGPVMKADNMHQAIGSSLQNAFPIGGSSLQQCVQNAVDKSAHAGTIDVSANMLLGQSSNVGMIEGINGRMIRSEGNHFSGQIPQEFSFSDLTADFSESSDILGSYSRLPVPDFDTNSFLDPHGRGGQGAMQNGSWKLL